MPVTFCLLITFKFFVWLLIYIPKSLIFNTISFFHLPLLFVSIHGHGKHARGAKMRVGGWGHMGDKKTFADVRMKLFWRAIYCANPRPNARSHFGSRYHRGLWGWNPRIICEYYLATAIATRPLIQTWTCKIGLSIFPAMIWIKFASTTRASFPRMLST